MVTLDFKRPWKDGTRITALDPKASDRSLPNPRSRGFRPSSRLRAVMPRSIAVS